ncbi:MAG: hypothetical protein AAF871_02740 [Pseudomonadota bacterium]
MTFVRAFTILLLSSLASLVLLPAQAQTESDLRFKLRATELSLVPRFRLNLVFEFENAGTRPWIGKVDLFPHAPISFGELAIFIVQVFQDEQPIATYINNLGQRLEPGETTRLHSITLDSRALRGVPVAGEVFEIRVATMFEYRSQGTCLCREFFDMDYQTVIASVNAGQQIGGLTGEEIPTQENTGGQLPSITLTRQSLRKTDVQEAYMCRGLDIHVTPLICGEAAARQQ